MSHVASSATAELTPRAARGCVSTTDDVTSPVDVAEKTLEDVDEVSPIATATVGTDEEVPAVTVLPLVVDSVLRAFADVRERSRGISGGKSSSEEGEEAEEDSLAVALADAEVIGVVCAGRAVSDVERNGGIDEAE